MLDCFRNVKGLKTSVQNDEGENSRAKGERPSLLVHVVLPLTA